MNTDLPARRSRRGVDAQRRPDLPVRRPTASAAGLILLLPLSGAVVVPLTRQNEGWVCAVITDPTGTHRPGHTTPLPDGDVQTALQVDLTDPTGSLDGDEFAALWLTRLWGHTRGGLRFQAGTALARQIRHPGTRTVTIDPVARRRLAVATHLRLPGVDRLLDHLTRDGYLALTPHTADQSTRQLTLPAGPGDRAAT